MLHCLGNTEFIFKKRQWGYAWQKIPVEAIMQIIWRYNYLARSITVYLPLFLFSSQDIWR